MDASTSDTVFPGNDFSNNIFTDLAPLLTLFGDQMTKQFLSMSMGWADNALIAVCPIGILTVMVSAIRVGGASKVKTLIGRYGCPPQTKFCRILPTKFFIQPSARESRAAAELELLSATSGEVCEMWSGSEIVRVAGQPSTIQYILDKTTKPPTVLTLSEALKQNIYVHDSSHTDMNGQSLNGAPSLTINVHNAISLSWQLLVLVVIGIVVQLTAFVLSAIIVYRWSWTAGSEMIASYGFPCYIIGTTLLTLGLLGCARVIQHNSRVDELSPRKFSARYQPFCVQKACTVDTKHFLSYAIFHPDGQPVIKMSRSNARDYNVLTLSSTAAALVGYICQFVGLRAMHWSVALIQLAATLTMTSARAFIRRGLANQPICHSLPMGTDAAGLSYLFSEINAWELPTFSAYQDGGLEFKMSSLSHLLGEISAPSSHSNDLILTAKSLSTTVPIGYPTSNLAQQLVNAILFIMEIYSRRQSSGGLVAEPLDCNEHCWAIQPSLRMNDIDLVHLPMKTFLCSSLIPVKFGKSKSAQENSALTADPETISAILILWLAVLERRDSLHRASAQTESETPSRPQYYRIIGNDSVPNGVPQGKAIAKWLYSQTALHTLNLTQFGRLSDDRQMKEVPVFGVQFSSRYLRFRAAPE